MDDSIEKYRKDKEIIRLTVEQIKKDFGSHLPEITLSGNPELAFYELKSQIEPVLQSVSKGSRSSLLRLLYRIDLRESAISALTIAELAEKIIQREFQKILIRKYFSSK